MSIAPGWPEFGAPSAPAPPEENPSSYRWAVVTSTAPLRIQFDGQTAPLSSTPDTLKAGLAVDDRVWCHIYGRSVIILGRAGG